MKGMRSTKQKKILHGKIIEMTKLFTAEDLLFEARKEDKNIGIATVYRFLNDSSRKEHIHSYECNRRKIYSYKTDNHCHFTCDKCGSMAHFNISEVSFLKNKLKGDVCHFQIDVHGICAKCKSSNNKP